MEVLISFFNQLNRGVKDNLVVLDIETNKARGIVPSRYNRSYTGIAADSHYVYALYNDELMNRLIIMRKHDFKQVLIAKLPEVQNAQSLFVIDDEVYIVSAGTNQVARYQFKPKTKELKFIDFFFGATKPDHECNISKLNSIYYYDNDFYLSGETEVRTAEYNLDTQGFILNVGQNRTVFDSLQTPSSMFIQDGNIYYCEEQSGRVKRNDEILLSTPGGYMHGLAKIGNKLVVGAGNGTESNRGDIPCQIEIFEFNNQKNKYTLLKTFDFSKKYQQVHDIIPL